MKEYFKVVYSMYRAIRSGNKLSDKNFTKALGMYSELSSEKHALISRVVKDILDAREYEEEDPAFYPSDYKSGERIYIECTERDCDQYEAHYVMSFCGPVSFEQWYGRNRDDAEGPLWLHYISEEYYKGFKYYGRDIAAEMMGY